MTHLQGGAKRKEVADSEDDDEDESSDDEGAAEPDGGELSTFAGNTEECKMVLCVRTDLGMGKGDACSLEEKKSSRH